MTVKVAPAALPMPRARWPAWRPKIVTKNHLSVVAASFHEIAHEVLAYVDRRREAERRNPGRQRQVVVDRLRHVGDRELAAQHAHDGRGAGRGVVTADRQEVRSPKVLQGLRDILERLGRAGGVR